MSSFLPFSLGHPGRQLEEVQRGPTQEHPHGPAQGGEEGGGVKQEVLLLNQDVGRVEVDLEKKVGKMSGVSVILMFVFELPRLAPSRPWAGCAGPASSSPGTWSSGQAWGS